MESCIDKHHLGKYIKDERTINTSNYCRTLHPKMGTDAKIRWT